MRQTFNLGFVCRQSKANRNGYAPVELTIVINGQRTYLTLPRRERPDEFKKAMGSKRTNDIKAYTSEVYSKVQGKMTDMLRYGIAVTPIKLKDFILKGYTDVYTINDLFSDYLKMMYKRVDVDLTLSVYSKHELTRDFFFTIIDKDRDVSDITPAVVSELQIALQAKYKPATVEGYMKRTKAVMTYGVNNGKLKTNPFAFTKIKRAESNVEFLTEGEVTVIENKVFQYERLTKVRDCFLFQCYTGLAYSDMASLVKDDIIDVDGKKYLNKGRNKTGVKFTVLLLPKAIDILLKYDYKLPVISNQKMNVNLKSIQDICGISKNLTSHVGRHTAATIFLNKGLSIDVVAKILGHSNTNTTRIYAKMLDKTVLEEMSKLI